MRKFSERGYNNADKTICRFKQRAFEICRLFRDTGLNAFMPYAAFGDFHIDKVSSDTVDVHFDLTDSWAYVKFPIEVMNMDDDEILMKFKAKDEGDLTYEIVEGAK